MISTVEKKTPKLKIIMGEGEREGKENKIDFILKHLTAINNSLVTLLLFNCYKLQSSQHNS